MNTYAIDGLCHNANRGTYGHECNRPATWIGTSASGFRSGYCDDCKEHGDEARTCTAWRRRNKADETATALYEREKQLAEIAENLTELLTYYTSPKFHAEDVAHVRTDLLPRLTHLRTLTL